MTATHDWKVFSTSLITDCMGRFGAMEGAITRLVGDIVTGPALTVQVVAGENGTIHRAVSQAPEGSVLVVAAGGYIDRAVWGEVLATAAVAKRIAGVVIDGAVRDASRLREIGLPTFARGTASAGPHKGWSGRIGAAIACGGVVVRSGDTILGDADGIAVIPIEDATRVHELAVERLKLEVEWLQRIAAGESTTSILDVKDA